MSSLEKEVQALKMKQIRIEQKQQKENEEVWSRIKTIERLAKENKTGVDAGISQNAQIAINKVALRRGWK